VVGEEESAAAVASRTFCEERVAKLAGGEFEGFFIRGGVSLRFGSGGFEGESSLQGMPADEGGVRAGGLPAQVMIEVADDEFAEAEALQRVEQDHGIPAA
jgi:hypothetical protein